MLKMFVPMAWLMVIGAEGTGAATTVADITTALTTALSTIASDVMGVLAAILPIALPILGAAIVVILGIKYFKKVSGTRA